MTELNLSQRDLTDTKLWKDVESYFHNSISPSFHKISHASDIVSSPDGKQLAFTGRLWTKLEGIPDTRICIIDFLTKELRILTSGPHHDSHPQFSPNGESLSFLSDRLSPGVSRPYLLDLGGGNAVLVERLSGSTEYAHWSPDGEKLLLGIAGSKAGKETTAGSGNFKDITSSVEPAKSWLPQVEGSVQSGDEWRSLWIYEIKGNVLKKVSGHATNVWGASWSGNNEVAALVSDFPQESAWYSAKLTLMDFSRNTERLLHQPKWPYQLSSPKSNVSGSCIAFVEAPSSDRGIVAGKLVVVRTDHLSVSNIDTTNVDVTAFHWLDEVTLYYAGIRGLDTVFGQINVQHSTASELWVTSKTCGTRYPEFAVLSARTFAIVLEGWDLYPEITIVKDDIPETILSLEHHGSKWQSSALGISRPVTWMASDGLEIQGLLTLPKSGKAPYPIILNLHGGPVWLWQNKWAGTEIAALYNARGFAVLSANPRGSTGRGIEFAQKVHGDMGGADHLDLLGGVEHLIKEGIADSDRIGVTGRSYGGYLST